MKIRVNPHTVEIVREQTEPINELEIKVSKCEFEFDEAITSDFVKEAYFTLNGETYKQIIVNNECDYPSEVLTEKGTLEIGVVAFKVENDEEIIRYNPSPDYFESWVGSLKEADNSEPITPTDKEQMEQALQNGLNDINDKIDEVDEKLDGIDTAIEETNNLNLDVSDKVDGDVTVTLTKKDASTKTVVLSDGTSLEFNWDGTKLGIKTSDEQEYTYVDLQGIQGPAGPQGEAFRIKKTYSSVAEMNADFNNMEYGDYVMIASSVEVEDNAKLYTRGESQWIFITDFSGATGIRGPVGATPNIQIGTVTSGSASSVTRTGTDENPVLNFVLQKGDKGDKGNIGDTGNGISSIEKTSTSGLVDTYTITYTNGNTTTFDVSNGKGIDRIEKTATVGNIDTYTIYFNDNSTSTFEVANGEVTKEELQEEVDRLSMIYNLFPTTSDEDTEMTLDGTGEVKLKKIGLKGNTYQYSTTGKNLFAGGDTTTTNGITFTKHSDGSYDIVGTATSPAYILNYVPLAESGIVNGETYTISTNQNIIGLEIRIESYNDNTWLRATLGGSITFPKTQSADVTGATRVRFGLFVNSGTTINLKNLKIQLEKGSSVTTFEKYTGGIASPNPDYPQDIHVVSGDNTIKVEGKNYCNGVNQDVYLNNTTNQYGVASNNSGLYIQVSGGNYTISTTKTQERYRVACSNNEPSIAPQTSYRGQNKDNTSNSITIDTTGYSYLIVNATDLSAIQIEKGTTATPYEPYQSQSYSVNLGTMELCKIGDYQDYIYKDNGKWYKHSEVGKVVLDGSETDWNYYTSTNKPVFYLGVTTNFNYLQQENLVCYSNYYQGKGQVNSFNDAYDLGNNVIAFRNTYKRLVIRNDNITSVSDFQTWLSTHNTIVYYVLATPTTTEITDTTLINQLNNLEKAYSYDEQTNISQVNNDLPFIITTEAILSLKNILNI